VAERERRLTPPRGGVFVPRVQVLAAEDVQRAITRIAHEIVERNRGLEDVVVIGCRPRGPSGLPPAQVLEEMEATAVPVGMLDVAFYRDDIGIRPVLAEAITAIPCDLAGQLVVLVDDVLFTGRTVRAALNAWPTTAGPGPCSWR